MEASRAARTGYFDGTDYPTPDLINVILSVREIGIAPRGDGVPDFERNRMVSVLDAFSRELALPPIEVVDAASRKGYRYWLYHGRHRLAAASIAVGFSVVPAVIVRSLDEIKRSEGMANVLKKEKASPVRARRRS